MKTTHRSRKEQDFKALPPPPPLSGQTISTHLLIHQQQDREAKYSANLTVKIFHQLLYIWPSHQMQIFQQGKTRYRLTHEEREQLKFLGLQNLFNTSWPKVDLHHRGLIRWKKS
jgi:hypothetical protein